jgi:hypothetical protein
MNLHLQSTLGTIGSLYASAVKAHGSVGDGQTQSGSAGLPAARIVDAVKRPEELVECVFWNSGS